MTMDLRSCPGGSLEAAVAMAGLSPPKDSALGSAKGPGIDLNFTASGDLHLSPRNLVLLRNAGTASAAELLIGALMSHRSDLRVNMQGRRPMEKLSLKSGFRYLTEANLSSP